MGTLRSAKALVGYAIHAKDGDIGRISEFYFDDAKWLVRYAVVDVGSWLLHQFVLIAPQALAEPDEARRIILANVTMEQVRTSPRIDTAKPIAIQHQELLHAHYGWEMYLGAEALMGSKSATELGARQPANADGTAFDPRLRSTRVVSGHELLAQWRTVGRVEDFLIDDESWTIHHLLVRMTDGRLIPLPSSLVRRINFDERRVYTDLPEERFAACPEIHPPTPAQGQGEERVFQHFGLSKLAA